MLLDRKSTRLNSSHKAISYAVLALLLLWMRIETAPGDVVFAPTSPFDEKQLSEIHLPAALTVTICLVVAVVGTVLQALGLLHGAVRGLVVALVGVAFMVGFLCWVYSGQDLPMTNPLWRTQFEMKDGAPQISAIGNWARGVVSERGADSAEVHVRAVFDDHDRVMVLITHNTDFGDSYEREAENPEYFYQMSVPGYAFGINTILYAMTH